VQLDRAILIAEQLGITTPELLKALRCFHDLGFMLWFSDAPLWIFQRPHELVEAISEIVTIEDQLTPPVSQTAKRLIGAAAREAKLSAGGTQRHTLAHSIDDRTNNLLREHGRLSPELLYNRMWQMYDPSVRTVLEDILIALGISTLRG
jgi:hypothetical protein